MQSVLCIHTHSQLAKSCSTLRNHTELLYAKIVPIKYDCLKVLFADLIHVLLKVFKATHSTMPYYLNFSPPF